MAENVLGSLFQDIADAIRSKTGGTDKMAPNDFPDEILSITVGGGGGGSAEGCVTVTFMNSDTVLFTRPVYVGDDCPDPVEQGRIETPAKESTVDTVYTHNGWTAADGAIASSAVLKNITEDKTVYAAYSKSVRKYTVTYYDEDGTTVLYTEQVAYGNTPSYAPTKDGAAFAGWTPTLSPVTGDVSYTASWITALDGGTCGDTAYWTLSPQYELTIYGTGAVTSKPWQTNYKTKIVSVVIEEGITSISTTMAFYGDSAITNVTLPSTLTEIGGDAFQNTSKITAVHIPSMNMWWNLRLVSVSSSPLVMGGAAAFINNVGVTGELVIPDDVTEIRDYQFVGWKKITSITFPERVTSIGNSAFYRSGLTSVVIPDTITNLGIQVFRQTYSLRSIQFGRGITAIPSGVCDGCSYLSSVVLPDNITSISGSSFGSCTALKNFTIPNSVTKIGYAAFSSSGLTSATFEDTDGWTVTQKVGGTAVVQLSATDLADPATAATYLKSTYHYYEWTKA